MKTQLTPGLNTGLKQFRQPANFMNLPPTLPLVIMFAARAQPHCSKFCRSELSSLSTTGIAVPYSPMIAP